MKLMGKKAIITGAGGGIGRAIAIEFAQNGCDCLVSDIDLDAAKIVAEEVKGRGRETLECKVDVRNKNEVDSMIQKGIDTMFAGF